jgi:hypothetical protein
LFVLTEEAVDIEVARRMHIGAQLRLPDDARGLVAFVGEHPSVSEPCVERGFATATFNLDAEPERVGYLAALFADVVDAIAGARSLRDRPFGNFGEGVGGAAVLIAAATHTMQASAVVTLNAPVELAGGHSSGVLAPTLTLTDSDEPEAAVDWFDRYLRGITRGQRREQWRSLQ